PIPLPFHLPTPIYSAMLAIWHLRPTLQRRFPLHRGRSRDFVRFLAWCASEGRRDYAILRAMPDWDAELGQPLALPVLRGDRWAGGFSVAMFLYGVAKHRYTFGALLSSAKSRARVARAFWRGERCQRLLPRPQQWQYDFLVRGFGSAEQFAETLRLPRTDSDRPAHQLIRDFRLQDVALVCHAARRPLKLVPAPAAVELPAKLRRAPLLLPLRVVGPLCRALERRARIPSQFELGLLSARISAAGSHQRPGRYPFGVNLFGYAYGELGIGEDVRLMALALKAHDIPFCIINVEPGANVSQQDASAEHWLADEPRYAINLFCMTGIEQVRYACEQGLSAFRDRYTIGLWPWELPQWPASWPHAFNLVDEIWGVSRYTAAAYRHAGCPVYPMSLPVTVDTAGAEDRAHFGLPSDDYLFVFSFDFNSTLARKNPAGLIQAFQHAFPRTGDDPVGLVLKASHSEGVQDPEWLRLKATADADPRIHLIEATLRKSEVLALYRCCDCFVSLHRAEGFGRGIVEALLLGLPVIATGFSGNMDYCTETGVSLVHYRMQALRPGDYFQGEGQCWADPDIGHAAELMRAHYSRPRPSAGPLVDFSPAAVGTRYAQRLTELRQQLNLKGMSPSPRSESTLDLQ
ncbi:MAG: glycosyltransferase, partial [Nitrococcus sp.]|nr:glycosyltransferase [Nitrococcus sp.]